jgi:hypothetical protein
VTTLAITIISVVLLLSIFIEKFVFRCIIKSITGYDCPFCGAQRALSHLMHGEFRNAFLANPFLFIISPYLLTVVLCIFQIFPDGSHIKRFAYNKYTIISFGALTILWGILRNTDFIKNILTFAGI